MQNASSVFAQEYEKWFSDQHKRTLERHCISSRGTDLWYSEACLKAINRAKKLAMKVKIGQVVHHTVLFLKRLRHLEFPVYFFWFKSP